MLLLRSPLRPLRAAAAAPPLRSVHNGTGAAHIFMINVGELLIVGIGMNGGHQAFFQAKFFM